MEKALKIYRASLCPRVVGVVNEDGKFGATQKGKCRHEDRTVQQLGQKRVGIHINENF